MTAEAQETAKISSSNTDETRNTLIGTTDSSMQQLLKERFLEAVVRALGQDGVSLWPSFKLQISAPSRGPTGAAQSSLNFGNKTFSQNNSCPSLPASQNRHTVPHTHGRQQGRGCDSMKGNFSRISLPPNGVVAVSLYGHACRLSQGLFNTSFVFCFGQALPLCPSRALLRLPPAAAARSSQLFGSQGCVHRRGAVIARVDRSAFQQ